MNEENFILEDIDRELTFDEKVNKIVDEFNPEAVEYTADDNNGWSVKIKDQKSGMDFWVDVWIDTNYNDVSVEWNQYIFDTNNANDNLKNAVQENNSVFDLATSEAINYLQEQNIIEQDDKANWYVVYHTPAGEFYEIYDEKFNTETGDIEGAGRIWNIDTGEEQEFVFTYNLKDDFVEFNDFDTGDKLDIKNDNLINEIKMFKDDHKDEISECVIIDENKELKTEANEDKYEFKPGYYEWQLLKNGKVIAVFNDFVDELPKKCTEENLRDFIDSYLLTPNFTDEEDYENKEDYETAQEFNKAIEGSDRKEIIEVILDRLYYEYGELNESKKTEAKDNTFKYNGYTFIPVGNVKSNVNIGDFIVWNKKLNSIFNADNGTYNYDELYKILPSYDIFRIPELDDILVVPSSRYLYKFYGKPDKYVPVTEIPNEEELKTPNSDGYIGTEEDKEVIDDLLDNNKDYMDISSKYGYSFNDYQLYNIATLYEKADDTVKTKIEDVLENINYHSECSEIIDNAGAFKSSLFESKKVTETIDEDTTKVIFRKDKEDGDIIAVFPEDRQNDNMIGCYAHMGQHSTMSLDYYKETVPATPEEYKDLKAELENIVGYNLEVVTELDESKKVTETVDEENSLDDIANYIKGIVDYNVSITPTGNGFSSYDVNFLNTDDSIMYSVMVNDDAIGDKVRLLNTLIIQLKRLYSGYTFADGIREDLLNELNKIHPVNKKTEDVAINNGFNITKYPEVQNLADDIANSIKDKEKVTINTVIEAIENWDNGFSSVITTLATADKNLANEIEKDEYDRYEAENQFLGLVEDTLNDMGITVYDEYDESKKVEGNKIPRNWKKITYKAKVDTNLNNVGDTIEVERDEWNRPIMKNLRTGKTGQTFIDNLRNDDLAEIVDIKTEGIAKNTYGKTNADEINETIKDKEFMNNLGITAEDVIKQVEISKKDFDELVNYVDNYKGTFGELYKELQGWNLGYDDVEKDDDNLFDCYYKSLLVTINVDDGKLSVSPIDVYVYPNDITNVDSDELFHLDFDKPIEFDKILKEDATQCGAVDGGRVSIFGEKEKIEEDTESKDLSKVEKLKLMDEAARSVNDEEIIDIWLMNGVPDDASELDYEEIAEDEENYREIEKEFKRVMKLAVEDGLYQCPPQAFEFAKTYEPDLENID